MPAGTDPSDSDPFEGLILDQSFVEGARAKEAAAHERMAKASRIARDHGQVIPPPPPAAGDAPAKAGRTGRLSRPRRRRTDLAGPRRPWVIALSVVVVGLLVWVFLGGRQAPSTASTSPGVTTVSASAGSNAPRTSTLSVTNPRRGDCLSPARSLASNGTNPVSVVACSTPHQQEIVELVSAAALTDATTGYPTGAAATALAASLCKSLVTSYVGGSSASALQSALTYVLNLPSASEWTSGQRSGWCAAVPSNSSEALTVSVHDLDAG